MPNDRRAKSYCQAVDYKEDVFNMDICNDYLGLFNDALQWGLSHVYHVYAVLINGYSVLELLWFFRALADFP